MKAMRRMLWYGVLLFLAIPVACRIASRIPYAASAAGTLLFTIGAAWPRKHTAESAGMAEDILGALADIGMSQKEAAYLQQISPSQFSAQISGRETFNGSRLPQIGPKFMVAWIKRMAARHGVTAVEDTTLGLLVRELRALITSRQEVA